MGKMSFPTTGQALDDHWGRSAEAKCEFRESDARCLVMLPFVKEWELWITFLVECRLTVM